MLDHGADLEPENELKLDPGPERDLETEPESELEPKVRHHSSAQSLKIQYILRIKKNCDELWSLLFSVLFRVSKTKNAWYVSHILTA